MIQIRIEIQLRQMIEKTSDACFFSSDDEINIWAASVHPINTAGERSGKHVRNAGIFQQG